MDITAVPESIREKPATPLEQAKLEYNRAMIAMGELDAKVIDTAATLDELNDAYAKAVVRVNDARANLMAARKPPPAETVVERRTDDGEGLRAIDCGQPAPGANGHAEDFEPPPAAA